MIKRTERDPVTVLVVDASKWNEAMPEPRSTQNMKGSLASIPVKLETGLTHMRELAVIEAFDQVVAVALAGNWT